MRELNLTQPTYRLYLRISERSVAPGMFGIEFFIVFGIGILISAGAMTLYHYAENDLRRAFHKLKQRI